ncbi:YncE family protein [Streptomyces sp. NPDC001544]|uniref:YncE family protein n=1 Tax=Streptomyces sp. NPDC001544 TaxID=3364584 RepID=UPI00369438DF
MAFTPNGARAYATNSGSGTVSVIDAATNTVTTTIPVGTTPYGVAFTLDGTHAHVANQGSNNVSVMDTATNTVKARRRLHPAARAGPDRGWWPVSLSGPGGCGGTG